MLYFEPNFVDEALVLLDRFGGDAFILAGGTRVGFRIRHDPVDTAALINLKRIAEMQNVTRSSEALRIGALTTAAQLCAHPEVRRHTPVLAAAAQTFGARQLRSVATLGGNICSGDPLSDLTAALLACDARCEIASLHEGPIHIALEQLVSKPAPVVGAAELLTAIEVPIAANSAHSYQKMTVRRSFELALVAVAATAQFRGGVVAQARIALAGAGATPLRATAAEVTLAGKALDSHSIAEAARCAAKRDADPADDQRASKEYRRHLIEVLTARALRALSPRVADGRA